MLIVTGANGFIGSAMVWELNRRDRHDILCVDHVALEVRPELLAPLKFAAFVPADGLFAWLESREALAVTGIFHMGACSSTTEMNGEYLRANNTDYTRKLFDFCARRSLPFIYASSGAVYGDGARGFDDRAPTATYHPLNPYGWSKAHFDTWTETAPFAPPKWYGLRFFNVYGPNENFKGDMASVAFKAFLQIRERGRLKLFRSHHPDYRDGEQRRDFVYVKDITRWMWELFSESRAESGLYNLGYGRSRTWLDLARAVFHEMGMETNIEWVDIPAHIRDQYQYFTEARIDKLLSQGVGGPQWDLESGIRDYLRNYLLTESPFLS